MQESDSIGGWQALAAQVMMDVAADEDSSANAPRGSGGTDHESGSVMYTNAATIAPRPGYDCTIPTANTVPPLMCCIQIAYNLLRLGVYSLNCANLIILFLLACRGTFWIQFEMVDCLGEGAFGKAFTARRRKVRDVASCSIVAP